jgi:hypothetical protein
MTIHVFAGPTIEEAQIRAELDPAIVSGPVAFGDVYRAARGGPLAIAIIDGYFENVPAVWHKEILWAMAEGVHVFGASSMGALRAAELADFGMEGVGAIFEAYRSGELEDDDEVAVVHGPSTDGFVPLSEAMVNIRATLCAAVAASVVGEATASALQRIAKGRFYADRTYAAILLGARSERLDEEELRRFREWLPKGRVDQKRADAKTLLARLRAWRATSPEPKHVSHGFERTDAWAQASRAMLEGVGEGGAAPSALDEAILEELKLDGGYAAAYRAAAARGAAIDEARRAGVRPDKIAFRGAIEEFCRERGYRDRREFDRWRAAQRLDDARLQAFFEDQARVRWARPVTDAAARASLVDHLRTTGEYGRLAEKAEAKRARLDELGMAGGRALSEDVGMSEPKVWQWYFRERLRRDVPEDVARVARETGFRDENDMRAAIVRELLVERDGRT